MWKKAQGVIVGVVCDASLRQIAVWIQTNDFKSPNGDSLKARDDRDSALED